MRCLIPLALGLLALAVVAQAETLVSLDFEQSTDPKAYPALSFDRNVRAEIVAGGVAGKGQCLRITNLAPDKYCQASVKLDHLMVKNLAVSFDHRETIAGGKPNYLGIIFNGPANSQWYANDKFTDQWRHFEVSPGDMHSPTNTTLTLETLLSRVNLYGRADNDAIGVMTVWLDNVRVHTDPRAGQRSENVRTSYTAAPFFHWGRNLGKVRLEYSPDPSFPAARTTTLETVRNWYVPDKLLAASDWYWRVFRDGAFSSGYSATEKIVIPAEAHKYIGKPIPFAELDKRPHPRIVPAQLVTEAKERASLIARAKSLYQQGVPDDPPAYAPGNPEWPTWIDWYGKVHGGITSRTGGKLQQMAQLYVQTRDPQVRDWLKEMALKAATWDPLGGSSIKGGDIGFHHFLRGLNWCYDALHEDLTDAEREKLRGMLIRRAELFYGNLNPFGIGHREYNNHAWLCTLALGESGLLLTGEYAPATDWAQYAYDLYCGLYLCGLGYQGDNNEGIAYWGYGLSFVIAYADMMKHVCDLDLFQHPWLYQTARFPMYTCPPGAWAVSFADTAKPNHSIFGPAYTEDVKTLALRTKDPYALWYAGGTAAEAGFEPKPPLDLPQSIFYRFIGWGVFNTSLLSGAEGVTVAMHSGKFWAGHQHEDQNSFVINAYGVKLAIDSGYYDWFGSPHFTKYSVLTRAHNAILVNGQDQDSRKEGADGVMKRWFDSPAFGVMVGDASDPDMYGGTVKQWDRRVLFVKPGLVIVHDVLAAANAPAQYDWLLHTVAPIATDDKTQGFSFTSGKASLNGRFLAPNDVGMKVVAGYPVEPVDGYSTRPVPPDKYAHEWTLWATPREQRQSEDFFAAMQIQKQGEAAAKIETLATQNGFGVRCVQGGETTVVLSRQRGSNKPVTAPGLAANGDMAAVTTDARGRPLRAFGLGGTLLQGAGINFVEANQPVDFAWVANALGEIVTIQATQPTRVLTMLNLRGAPDLTKAPGVRIRPVKGLWELQVPAGVSEIIWPAATVKTAPPGSLKLTHYALPVGTQASHYWWGLWNAPQHAHYSLTLKSAAPVTSFTLDGKPVDPSATPTLWLKPGNHALLLSGPAARPELKLTPLPSKIVEAPMLPKGYAPAAGALVIEAEKPASEGQVKGLIVEKVGASGKLANGSWDTDGMWATWQVTVPQAGDYRLLIRGCSEQPEVLRSVAVDGKLTDLRMSGTGGWSRTTDDWRYFAVPVTLHLAAGPHTIRLERLDGSMNLDCLVLEVSQ